MILLWRFGLTRFSRTNFPCEKPATCLPMKPARLVLTPTRNRRLNELVGLLVLASAVLLFLSLVSYHPTDPSFNTVGSGPVRNWIGPAGAYISDLLLQIEGVLRLLPPPAHRRAWLDVDALPPRRFARRQSSSASFSPSFLRRRSSGCSRAIRTSSMACPSPDSRDASSPTSSSAGLTSPARGS